MTAPSLLVADDAELDLLGEVLVNPRCARDLAGVVTPDDFRDIRRGNLFGLVVGMVAAGEHVDSTTVAAELMRRRAAAGKGDRSWLTVQEIAPLVGRGAGIGAAKHAQEVAEAALRRANRQAGVALIEAAENSPDAATIATSGIEQLRAVRDAHATGGRFAMRTLGEILDTEDEGYDWVIPGLLERSDRFILTGEEGAGKTVLMRQIIVAAGAGIHPFNLSRIKPVRTCVLDVENSERMWRRKARAVTAACRRAGSADPRETVRVECTGRIDITQADDLANIHAVLDEHEPDILMLGPLYKFTKRAIQTDDEAAPVLTALDSIRERGVTLLIEAHAGHSKDGNRRDLRPRGSSALLGWPEFGYGLGFADTSGMSDDDALIVEEAGGMDLTRWRGDRDEREWPNTLVRGGPMPWTDYDLKCSESGAMALRQFRGQSAPLEVAS